MGCMQETMGHKAERPASKGHTLALTSRTESSSATWITKSWTPSVKRTINWRGGIGPPLLNTSTGMGSARCLPLAFSLRGCIRCKLFSKGSSPGLTPCRLRNACLPYCIRSSTADGKTIWHGDGQLFHKTFQQVSCVAYSAFLCLQNLSTLDTPRPDPGSLFWKFRRKIWQ